VERQVDQIRIASRKEHHKAKHTPHSYVRGPVAMEISVITETREATVTNREIRR